MADRDLLGISPPQDLSDEELRAVLHAAIRTGIHGYREADLMLAAVCADRLLNRLRIAGVVVHRPMRDQPDANPRRRD